MKLSSFQNTSKLKKKCFCFVFLVLWHPSLALTVYNVKKLKHNAEGCCPLCVTSCPISSSGFREREVSLAALWTSPKGHPNGVLSSLSFSGCESVRRLHQLLQQFVLRRRQLCKVLEKRLKHSYVTVDVIEGQQSSF